MIFPFSTNLLIGKVSPGDDHLERVSKSNTDPNARQTIFIPASFAVVAAISFKVELFVYALMKSMIK